MMEARIAIPQFFIYCSVPLEYNGKFVEQTIL